MNTKIALKNNKIVGIEDVEKGLKCNCFCIDCGEILIAKKGMIKEHHFAHSNACKGNEETYLHKVAKEILRENNKITLPNNKSFDYNFCEIEKTINDIKPDVILTNETEKLLVEIAVTHFIDETKKEKIVKLELPTIEIDLSKFNYNSELSVIKNAIIDQIYYKKFIFKFFTDIENLENNSNKDNEIQSAEIINKNENNNITDNSVINFILTIFGFFLFYKLIKWIFNAK